MATSSLRSLGLGNGPAAPGYQANLSTGAAGRAGEGSGGADPSQVQVDWYQQMLANDPQLAAALQAIASQQSAYQGQAQTAEQQLLEQYGEVPSSLLGQYASILSPTVSDLASQATQAGTSTVAQLLKAFQNQQSGTLDSLAARGLLRSGATGYDQNQNLTNYGTAKYNALQQLLGNLGTQQSNYLQQVGTLNQQSETATTDAYQRILAQIQAGTLTAPPPSSFDTPPPSNGGGGGGAAGGGGSGTGPAAPSVPYNPKPPTPEVGGNENTGYYLNPGVGARSGSGGYGYGALS